LYDKKNLIQHLSVI